MAPPSGTEAGEPVPGLAGVGLYGFKPAGVPGSGLLTGTGSYPLLGVLEKPPGRRITKEVNTGEIEDKSVGTAGVGFVVV